MANPVDEQTTKQVRIWPNAWKALQDLQPLLAAEKGMPSLTLTEAASIAIIEAIQRRGPIPSPTPAQAAKLRLRGNGRKPAVQPASQ